MERVRARIVEPFEKLQHETLVLARQQSTCELLRRVIRCLAVTKKLKVQLSNCPRELTKAATSISELGTHSIVQSIKMLQTVVKSYHVHVDVF